MDEIIPVKTPVKRRRFTKAFKARLLAQCDQPGVSVASVALAHKINANLIHKWRRLAKDKALAVAAQPHPDFLPIALPAPVSGPSASVVIEVNGVKLHWPLSHIDQSIAWLRALQA